MKFAFSIALSLCAITLAGCATPTAAPDTAAAGAPPSARCEQTGSNLPRRDCRDVEVLKPNQIESLKGSNRPTSSGN
jgi:hypothetical protein